MRRNTGFYKKQHKEVAPLFYKKSLILVEKVIE
jgi:hypothetical protein